MPRMVPNPYKAAIARALATVRGEESIAGEALDPAKRAVAGNAWTGGQSDAFESGLAGKDSAVTSAAQACVTELEQMHSAQADMVEEDAWQTRWHNL